MDSFFCPSPNNSIYTCFIHNQLTIGHESVIFGLGELNSIEWNYYCLNQWINSPPISDRSLNLTSNYELWIHTLGSYYLDLNNNWKYDGLKVGSLINYFKTECFSTDLTRFASGFIVLLSPIKWNYALQLLILIKIKQFM